MAVSMVGGCDARPEVMQREFQSLVLYPTLWQTQRCSRTARGSYALLSLTEAFFLIEGHPTPGWGRKTGRPGLKAIVFFCCSSPV